MKEKQKQKYLFFRFFVWGGRLFSWGCVFFVLLKLRDFWEKVKFFDVTPVDFLFIIGIVVFWSAVNYVSCFMWGKLAGCLSDKHLNFADLAYLFARSNLAKYLPGNVMHYVSRSILAQKYHIPLQVTALTSFLDATLSAGAAFLFVSVTLHWEFLVLTVLAKEWLRAIGAIFVTALLIGVALLKKALPHIFSGRFSKMFLGVLFQNTLLYLLYYFITSCIFYVLLLIVRNSGPHYPVYSYNFFQIAGLYTLAWLIGYLIPGASGGIGVREAMLLTLFRSFAAQETILTTALLLRTLSILSEVFAYAFSVIRYTTGRVITRGDKRPKT
ncbi:MAG: hypothetical protein LBD04_07555 [Synergistaceae bacterium]|nr:hypothetical protein [Synergistaceae bacterium]